MLHKRRFLGLLQKTKKNFLMILIEKIFGKENYIEES